jgi:3-hydroxy-3-methylglutaryl CoA synthase
MKAESLMEFADSIVAHSPNIRIAHKATELLYLRDAQEKGIDLPPKEAAQVKGSPPLPINGVLPLSLSLSLSQSLPVSVYLSLSPSPSQPLPLLSPPPPFSLPSHIHPIPICLRPLPIQGYALQAEVDSSYTASTYVNLVSLLSNVPGADLVGKRLLIYSYGSGCASTLYTMKVRSPLANPCNVEALLNTRVQVSLPPMPTLLKPKFLDFYLT